MKISVKVNNVKIVINEDVNNTQIKYNNKEIIEVIKTISAECIKLHEQSIK